MVMPESAMQINQMINQINKQFGEFTLIRASEAPRELFGVKVVPTGVYQLDYALGVGGIPRGRTIEIYGPASAGKTSLALIMIAAAQRAEPDFQAAIIDAEQAFDPALAEAYGVDMSRLYICQPASGEEAIDVARAVLINGVDLVLIDSVTALVPASEVESTMDSNFVGLQARLMSKALRVLTPVMNHNKRRRGIVIFINQIREKVGVMFGSPETTSGGRALGFYSSIRLAVRSGTKDDKLIRKITDPYTGKSVDDEYGQVVRINVVKNKVGTPHKKCEFNLIFGEGVDRVGETLSMATMLGIVEVKGGGNHSYVAADGTEVKVRGKDNFYRRLEEDKELHDEIRERIAKMIHKKVVHLIPAEEHLELTEEGYDL